MFLRRRDCWPFFCHLGLVSGGKGYHTAVPDRVMAMTGMVYDLIYDRTWTLPCLWRSYTVVGAERRMAPLWQLPPFVVVSDWHTS